MYTNRRDFRVFKEIGVKEHDGDVRYRTKSRNMAVWRIIIKGRPRDGDGAQTLRRFVAIVHNPELVSMPSALRSFSVVLVHDCLCRPGGRMKNDQYNPYLMAESPKCL